VAVGASWTSNTLGSTTRGTLPTALSVTDPGQTQIQTPPITTAIVLPQPSARPVVLLPLFCFGLLALLSPPAFSAPPFAAAEECFSRPAQRRLRSGDRVIPLLANISWGTPPSGPQCPTNNQQRSGRSRTSSARRAAACRLDWTSRCAHPTPADVVRVKETAQRRPRRSKWPNI